MTHEEMISVIQSHKDGKQIEWQAFGCSKWDSGYPTFNFGCNNYRVKKSVDYIDWSHVAPCFKWMARDSNGLSFLFKERPTIGSMYANWTGGDFIRANCFASYKKGDCEWRESLVSRPSDDQP